MSCCDLVVLMNQAAEAVPAPNAGGGHDHAKPSPDVYASVRAKLQVSVWSLVVVVPQVLVEGPLKVTATPDQHPVQTPGRTVRTQR